MTLHPKQLGTLGEIKIAADLISKGYEVFTELGDNSKVDLIVLDENHRAWKLQVKTRNIRNGTVWLDRRKSGPNYRFRYEAEHADVYAMYVNGRDLICYVPASMLMQVKRGLTIRIDPAKNNNSKLVNFAEDFSDFKKALRGHTCST